MPMVYESLLIGIVVAVLFAELLDIYPGGIIVPAYLALYLDRPLRVLVTLAVALLSLYTYKFLSRYLILFGRRRFVMMILLGVVWAQGWVFVVPQIFQEPLQWKAVGWIIPGLLANNLEKQRFMPTIAALFTVAIITYFLVRFITLFL